MMIASHFMTVVTDPGQMPRNYEHLHEEDLPKEFYNLISLRESIYAELVVKKKMRKGELTRESIPNFENLRLSQSRRSNFTHRSEKPMPKIDEEEEKVLESGSGSDGYNRADIIEGQEETQIIATTVEFDCSEDTATVVAAVEKVV